jgi:Xaa-Pro aminopeptidase
VSAPDPVRAARARYARVQAAMAGEGAGALLLATPHLAAFASGARRVQVAGSGGALPWVVITAGAPAAHVFTPDPDGAPPWMPRASVEPLCWDRARQLARIRALVAPGRGALACDVFSPALAELATTLGRPLIDAAPLLAAAATSKTDDEVALVVRALAAARAAVRAAGAAVGPGEPVAAVLAAAAAAPDDVGFPLAEGRVWRLGGEPERLAAEAGIAPDIGPDDVLALEVGVYVGGYAGVAGDTVRADGQRLAHARRTWSTALCKLAACCRAGATTADLRAAAGEAGATQAGLLAHGLGIGLETPHVDLRRADTVPLAAGTVLVLAPVVDGFRATRALLVTDGAARWLEPAP